MSNASNEPPPAAPGGADSPLTPRNIPEFLVRLGRRSGVSLSDSNASGSADGSQSQARAFDLEEGRRYRLEQLLGSGGMGEVRQAKDLNIRRHVAMKMMRPDRTDAMSQMRFIEEAQVTGQMEHPGIVPVYELGVNSEGTLYYTMKLVNGVTLQHILHRLADRDPEMVRDYPLSRLLRIFQRVLDAVAFAHHKGVVHRDLKPDNIMIGDFGEVVVMDWGLAKVVGTDGGASASSRSTKQPTLPGLAAATPDSAEATATARMPSIETVRTSEVDGDASFTRAGQLMGTPRYMAPEQSYSPDVDERADIYALGGILYYILALRPALEGKQVTDVLVRLVQADFRPPAELDLPPGQLPHIADGVIPVPLSAVCMRAMARDKENRYAKAVDLQDEIDAWLNGFATLAEGAGTWRQVRLFIERHRVEAALSSLAVLALMAVIGMAVVRLNAAKNRALASEQQAQVARQDAEDQRAEAVQQRSEAEQQRAKAETERQEADRQRAKAEEERQEADRQRAEVEKQRAVAEANLETARAERAHAEYAAYVANLGLAQSQLAAGLVDEAAATLAQAAPRLRQWEWNFLANRLAAAQRRTWQAHRVGILRTRVASTEARVLSIGEFDPDALLWSTGNRQATRLRTQADLVDGDFAPGGAQLATLDGYNTLTLWNLNTSKAITTVKGDGSVYFPGRLAFSPDGRYVAALLSREDHRELWLYEAGHLDPVHKVCDLPKVWEADLAWLPDSRRVAVTNGNDVEVWDPEKPKKLNVLRGHGSFVFCVAVAPDGRYLAAGGRDRTVRVWDLQKPESPPQTLAGHSQAVNAVAFTPNGEQLISGGNDGRVMIWERASGRLLGGIEGAAVSTLAVNRAGTTLWAGYADGRMGEWPLADILSGNLDTARLRFEGFTWEQFARFSPNGSRVILGDPSSENPALLVDSRTGERISALPLPRAWSTAAWSPDGMRLLAAGVDGHLLLYKMAGVGAGLGGSGSAPTPTDFALAGGVLRDLVWSPDGLVVAGGGDTGLAIWTVADGTVLWSQKTPTRTLAFTPDSKSLIVGGGDGVQRLNAATGERESTYARPENAAPFLAAALSRDGSTVAAVGDRVYVWDAATGELRHTFPEAVGAYATVTLSADGSRAFTGGRHAGLRIWDTTTGSPLLTLHDPMHWVGNLDLSADGRYLVSCDQSGTFIVYPATPPSLAADTKTPPTNPTTPPPPPPPPPPAP